MDDIVRTKAGRWEKVFAYSYLGFTFLGILGNSLLEDAGVESFWIRILLIVVFMIVVLVVLGFPAVCAGRRRLAVDRANGVVECAVRFPSSVSGSLRDLWDGGAAQITADGLAFQPQGGQLQTKPAGKKRKLGHFVVVGPAEMTGKKTPGWGRSWSIRELHTDAGRIHLAASPKSWALIEGRSNREPHGTL
ncbi:hypothetical protein [Arthrobacter pityocampae]|uniref:hypothetical protein n=1 Tax=Arthrobacter pityocampae TaxID=547334 RepID=UPI0037359934